MTIAEKLTTIAENQQRVYDKGIEQGKENRDVEFWKVFQHNGNRTDYAYAFQSGWNTTTFKPKYDMNVTNCNNMFGGNATSGCNLDLRKSAIGITINFSGCTSFNNCFSYTYANSVVAIGTIDTRKASSLSNMFNCASALHTVEKLILKNDGSQTYMDMYGADKLANITIEGVIGNNISFQTSPLSKESIMGKALTSEEYEKLSDNAKTYNVRTIDGVRYYGGIITALKADATGKTLTLRKSAKVAAFTEDEWITLITPKSNQYDGNWTISLL